jgi:hypothetical protein
LEQPKKPGPRDITDLKARLGLNRGPAQSGPPGAPVPSRPPFGTPAGQPPLGAPTSPQQPFPGAMGMPAPAPAAPVSSPAPDPYASMRPPAGRQFDLRPVDDGIPVANVRRGGFRGALIFGLIMVVFGGMLGIGFGIGMSGRRAYNETNRAAKRVRTEIEEMHKTVTQIATAVALSHDRLQKEKRDRTSYDARFIEELERVKLDPRPDTSRIFTVDYFRMPNIAVDNLMSYYYDTIALYGEVEKHVKKTRADKESLEAFAAAQKEKVQGNYGVVFAGGGKMVVANLVEVGQPVCKDGGAECPVDQLDGFKIRSISGASWVTRKIGPKPEGNILVPIDRTPLLESAMAGSPDQARMEQYRLRTMNIQLLLVRINQTQKQLTDAIKTAASRPDMFSL